MCTLFAWQRPKTHKAALSLHDIYCFQPCKRTHYCMWAIDYKKQDSQLRFYCRLCLQITVRCHDIKKKTSLSVSLFTVWCTMEVHYCNSVMHNVWIVVNIHQKRVLASLLFSCLFLSCSFIVWICNTVLSSVYIQM